MLLIFPFIIILYLINRSLINSSLINLAGFALIAYWITYPIEKLNVGGIYTTIEGIKDVGIWFYAIFAFSFIAGLFLTSKLNFPKIKLYSNFRIINHLFFISIFLGIFGFICFAHTYNYSLLDYFNIFFDNRVERLALLSSSNNALPYSISFIPSITILIVIIKNLKFNINLVQKIAILFIFMINSPILISYFLEGDRTSIIKFFMIVIFTSSLKESSIEEINNKEYLIQDFRINKSILKKRLFLLLNLTISFLILVIIGLGRGNGWKNISRLTSNFQSQMENKLLPTSEFRSVNFTIDYSIAREHLTNDRLKKMFTWDRGIFYPLPTYVYKTLFKENKPPNVGDGIGIEVKNYIFGDNHTRKIGFGLSPIAEGYINSGLFGIIFIGFIYGACVRIIQESYNKISIKNFSLFDLIIINSASMIPLMMRAGAMGIYNWIFSITFISFLPILIIEFLKNLKLVENK